MFDPTQHPKWERQQQLERDIVEMGVERYRKAAEKAIQAGRAAGSVAHVRAGVQEYLQDFIDAILAELRAPKKQGQRPTVFERYITESVTEHDRVTAEEVAFIAVKTTLDQVLMKKPFTSIMVSVGQAIQDERRMRYYRGENTRLFDAIMRNAKIRQQNNRYVRVVIKRTLTTAEQNPVAEWQEWPQGDLCIIGTHLVDLLEKSTGLVHSPKPRRQKGRRQEQRKLVLTPAADVWFQDRKKWNELLFPAFLYSVMPPKDWTTPEDGGYWTKELRDRVPLVKPHVRGKKHQEYLAFLGTTEMPTVYDAVNAIQRTAWRINESILAVLNEAHDSKNPERQQIAGLPFQDNLPLPVKPIDIATNVEARRAWSKRAAPVYSENARAVSRRLQLRKTLYTAAQALAEDTPLHFTHQLDFRGRVYPLTTWLSPQAADYAKALLTFAEGEPITEQVQVDWLAIHGANCYGIDKVSMEDRIAWVQEHEAEITASAGDPFANKFWADGDKPWQFLAFCFEWAAMRKAGTWGYLSSLPVYVDGTCNGLQHFSAMLRDEVGGVATNLTPSEKPQDIYQTVADAAIKALKASDDPLAQVWLDFGITRKTTKRSVMIVPYGGTLHACRSYIDMHVKDRVREGDVFPFSDPKEVKKACMFLAKIVWSAIDDTVVKAREAMKWLQRCARVAAKAKCPLQWRTPTGFTVRQAYPEWKKFQVETLFHGKIMKMWLQEEKNSIKADKQSTACSPNFVHSMDASALMLYAQRMGDAPLAMVHDAYGTTAARTEQMARLLREAFVEMYTNHDVLTEFRESCIKALGTDEGIPPVPKSGLLRIEEVLNSRYFFA